MRGSLRHRDGAWRLQVYAGLDPVTGKEIRVTRTVAGPDTRAGRKAAEEALARLVLEVSAENSRIGEDPTLGEVIDRWIALHAADWSPTHLRETRWQAQHRIPAELAATPVSKVRPVDLDQLYSRLRVRGSVKGGPLAPATVRHVHSLLHGALGQAVKWGLIASNPAMAASPPRVPTTDIRPPSPDAVAAALATVAGEDQGLYTFLRLAATTGARRSQLCALHWTDVDLEAATIVFSRAVVTGEDGLVEKGTKNGRTWKVALDPTTHAQLERWRRLAVERALALGARPGTYVFARDDHGEAPWRPDTATKRWVRLRDRIDADGNPLHDLEGVRLHDLRHFVTTQMLAAGVDHRTISERLGWSSMAMLNRYGHFMPEKDREAAVLMEAVLRPDPALVQRKL